MLQIPVIQAKILGRSRLGGEDDRRIQVPHSAKIANGIFVTFRISTSTEVTSMMGLGIIVDTALRITRENPQGMHMKEQSILGRHKLIWKESQNSEKLNIFFLARKSHARYL